MTAAPFVLPTPTLPVLPSLEGGQPNAPSLLLPRGAASSDDDGSQPALRRVDSAAALRHARLLLVGDDGGVDRAAAPPPPSLPALLAQRFPGVAIVNTCRRGACVADVAQALARGAPGRQRFDVALVLLGRNDVVQATPQHQLTAAASALLHELRWHATHIVWLGSASVGRPPLGLTALGGWASRRDRRTLRALAQVARAQGVTFIDLGPPPLAERWHGTARSRPLGGRASPVECFTALEQRVPLQAWLSGPGRGASHPNRPIQE